MPMDAGAAYCGPALGYLLGRGVRVLRRPDGGPIRPDWLRFAAFSNAGNTRVRAMCGAFVGCCSTHCATASTLCPLPDSGLSRSRTAVVDADSHLCRVPATAANIVQSFGSVSRCRRDFTNLVRGVSATSHALLRPTSH